MFAAAACDQGEQDDDPREGPPIALVAANVGPDQPLPANGTPTLTFDRFLLPATAIRQSFLVRDPSGNALLPVIQYDPVARSVAVVNPDPAKPAWLSAGVPYSLELPAAPPDNDQAGVRAFDRAPLAAPLRIAFNVVAEAPLPPTPDVRFCRDVLPLFQQRCSAGSCHGAPQDVPRSPRFPDGRSRPAVGLVLETPEGVARTAIGRIAVLANTGPRADTPSATRGRFAIDMPIVAPRNPGNSFLLYKLLLAGPPAGTPPEARRARCDGSPGEAPASFATASDAYARDDERARLGQEVFGEPMPPPRASGENDRALTLDELQRIRAWIQAGARVEDCAPCE